LLVVSKEQVADDRFGDVSIADKPDGVYGQVHVRV
jgi:hypothetical protein